MKAYRKDPDFKPVVIEIESEDELLYLWHCLNVDSRIIEQNTSKRIKVSSEFSKRQMWQLIDKLLNPSK